MTTPKHQSDQDRLFAVELFTIQQVAKWVRKYGFLSFTKSRALTHIDSFTRTVTSQYPNKK